MTTIDQHISKPKLKFAKSLSQKKTRAEERLFVVEGWRAVEDACRAGVRAEMFLYTPAAKENANFRPVFESAESMARESYEASERELSAVSETVTSPGVALILPQFTHDIARELSSARGASPNVIIALDRISEPGNAGTIIRTADWFGAGMVILSEESVDMYNPKVVRSTMGSIFHIPVIECGPHHSGKGRPLSFLDALRACRAAGYTLYGADVSAAEDVRRVQWAEKSLIVIGSEAHGLSQDVLAELDARITIPGFGQAESLNAGSAAAVILGTIRLRQR